MGVIEILLIAFGVSVDAAAVSVAGAISPGRMSRWRCAGNAALFFGGSQFVMPVIGFFCAGKITAKVAAFDRYLAFAMLALVGGKMLVEAWHGQERKACPNGEFFSAGNMIVPALATSLDALAVGAGIAFAGHRIWYPAAAMGIVTAAVSTVCVYAGSWIGRRIGVRWAASVGGVAVIIVGIKFLTES